jgi:hypothetical protein
MIYRLSVSCFAIVGIFLGLAGTNSLHAADVRAKLSEDGRRVTVTVDGQPFAEYLTKSGTKPAIWPIIGPSGKRMTREYPMAAKAKHERADHPHHRSLWFTHGDVDGVDFWAERFGSKDEKAGVIKHREFVKIESGNQAVIVTQNDWCKRVGDRKILEDQTSLTFGCDDTGRWIDYEITLKAGKRPVRFGDTKEGCFGIRVAAPLKPDAKLGGLLINGNGEKNKAAWGKAADWIDYSGPVDGETVGVAMMNHPSSFRYPTRWHARTYGLCSANPFGLSYFVGEGNDGTHTIPAGGSITFRYRVLLHKGDAKAAKVAEAYRAYAKTQ